jgi:hypothetical protein
VHGPAVVGDDVLGHPQRAAPADAFGRQRRRGRVGLAHRAHVGQPDEPLTTLRELQHDVVVVDLVGHVLVLMSDQCRSNAALIS